MSDVWRAAWLGSWVTASSYKEVLAQDPGTVVTPAACAAWVHPTLAPRRDHGMVKYM